VGLVASQVVLDDDPTLLDSAGIEVDWAGVAWNRRVGLPVADEPEEPIDVFGSTGAGGLYVKKMLDQIGLLDDDFFIYYDDADIAWRGQRAGWRCIYTPYARLRHIHSGTSGKWSSFKAYLLGRNKIWTMVKNYPLKSFLLHLPVILFFELAAIFYALIFFKDTAALQGRLSAIRHISIPLAKRKQFNQTVKARPVQLAPVPSLKSAWKKHRSIPRNP
jgi:GT2 family glycosyltransferase